MPLLLRKIRKSKWYLLPWLSKGDLQADSIVDLSTKNNELSVWFIKDDKSNLERIITALAARCDYLSNFDYALFNPKILEEKNIKKRRSKGSSADDEANELWHLNLYELSALKILSLAQHIFNDGKIKRIQEKQIGKYINKGLQEGKIKPEVLKDGIKSKIGTLI
ncbi:MAG: hypothetical protein KAX28_08360 [Candidatus Marinimicrobia bacterium]|nr:hypothetical protein [Candidatus Neomarinimicrobiota bacterium]